MPKRRTNLAIMPASIRHPAILERNLRPDEPVPFVHGLEAMTLDHNWVWAAIHKTRICGLLVGANVHGMFYILRIVIPRNAPRSTALVLLRQVRKSVSARGLEAWTTFLMPSPDTPIEEKLTRLSAQMQAQILPVYGVWIVGKV